MLFSLAIMYASRFYKIIHPVVFFSLFLLLKHTDCSKQLDLSTKLSFEVNLGLKNLQRRSTKVFVPLKSLPDGFSNDKIPNKTNFTDECLKHYGCFERFPVITPPENPEKIKTNFKVISRKRESSITFKSVLNCLPNSNTCNEYPLNLNEILDSPFNPHLRTIIITSGYLSGATNLFTEWTREIGKSWLKLEDVNIIITDWRFGNVNIYYTSVANTKVIARQITVLLYYFSQLAGIQLDDENFLSKIYLVGHSLGAHISGFVGKDFLGKIGRITGLDPAGPEFTPVDLRFKLNRGDAKLVEAIHTNAGTLGLVPQHYGIEQFNCHIDYMANNGKIQPMCAISLTIGCSHSASHQFYKLYLDYELVSRNLLGKHYHKNHRLLSYKSKSFDDFIKGTSLSNLCPETVLNDNYLESEDLNQCTLPIDFYTPVLELRNELEEKFGINFADDSAPYKYFFFTSRNDPPISNHLLIKIRLSRAEVKQCDIEVHMQMSNPSKPIIQIVSEYTLLDLKDHLEALVTYLSASLASQAALMKLDAYNFYLNETDQDTLQEKILKIFPKTLEIHGLTKSRSNRRSGPLPTLPLPILPVPILSDLEVARKARCQYNIESITIQPLMKMQRHLIAVYSTSARTKLRPDLIVLEPSSYKPMKELTNREKFFGSQVYIDTVIIGPLENSDVYCKEEL